MMQLITKYVDDIVVDLLPRDGSRTITAIWILITKT